MLHKPRCYRLDFLHLHVVVKLGDFYFFLLDEAIAVWTISIHSIKLLKAQIDEI